MQRTEGDGVIREQNIKGNGGRTFGVPAEVEVT
jgi:hypothetical protein